MTEAKKKEKKEKNKTKPRNKRNSNWNPKQQVIASESFKPTFTCANTQLSNYSYYES